MNTPFIILFVVLLCALFLLTKITKDNDVAEHMTTDLFETLPIFVINLKARPIKKMKTLAQLSHNNLKATFIEAVDGRDLDVNYLESNGIISEKHNHRILRRGEIGCYLSHIECWRMILESGMPYGLVLEDDVVFINNFKERFNDIFSHLKDLEWDIIGLGRRCKPTWFSENCYKGTVIYGDAFYPAIVGYGAFAYIIKASTIHKLLATTFPITKPIDVVILEEQYKGNLNVISFKNDLVTVFDIKHSDTTAIK